MSFDPSVGFLVPGIGDWTREDLNPELFVAVWIELGESAGDASERVDFEGIESFDRQYFIFGKRKLRSIDDIVTMNGFSVILIDDVNLDAWILGINLTFDEALESFRHVDIKTNLSARGNNLETEMLLGGARLT